MIDAELEVDCSMGKFYERVYDVELLKLEIEKAKEFVDIVKKICVTILHTCASQSL